MAINLGVVETDKDSLVINYLKARFQLPGERRTYVFEPRVLKYIPRDEYLGFSRPGEDIDRGLERRSAVTHSRATGKTWDARTITSAPVSISKRTAANFYRIENMNWIVPLSDVKFGVEEQDAVRAVLESGWLTMGEVTARFEDEFKAYTGAKHTFAVSNATVALHMACLALGIGPGDEVIVPSLTLVATANAVRYTGAEPVFADIISENDLTISLESIRRAVSPRTKAVMVMHYAGYACDMPAILEWAQGQGLQVIEDAAHAVGSFLDGRHLGTWGAVGCFSFFSNKNLSTGEGGMIVTDDDRLAEQCQTLPRTA